jgi:hypothetical protein
LVTCEITTASADIAFDKPVHVKAEVQVIKAPDDQSVRLRLQRAASATGPWTDLTQVVSRTITTAVSPPNQIVEADLLLATPNPVPAYGADVFFKAVATNNQAVPKESAVATVKYRRLTEMVGPPEIAHEEHSLVPRLGDDGKLVRALAAYLSKIASHPPATADKAVVFGFSFLEPDLKKNRKLSLQRAEMLKALLDRDSTLWEKHRGDVTVKDKQQVLSDLNVGFGWNCSPGKVDGIAGPDTTKGVFGFQKEYNKRYVKLDGAGKPLPGEVLLVEDGVCGKNTWNGIHRALCALVAKQMDPAFADPAAPSWQLPDWHYAPGAGAYPNGQDFPPPDRSAELNLFHPSDAPALATPTDTTALTVADNPVEDPAKYQKMKIPVAPLGGTPPVDPDRAVPTIETYDPTERVTESGTNPKRIERSGQVVEVRQWVNLTTKDHGRDGKGTKVKLRIRSKDGLRDEANAKKLPDQVFLKVVYSADGGPANRVSRSDAANKFGLVTAPNLASVVSPSAASLQRAASGGWQTTPAAPWEYTATINTAGAKVVEIELDLGLCGGDTCEVQVGGTNACDNARVRFVNWRRLEYELMVADCQKPNMDSSVATRWDFRSALKSLVTQRLGAGFVAYESRATHVYTKAQADPKQWVTASYLQQPGAEDRIVRAWKWRMPSGVSFLAADKRTVRMVTGDILVDEDIRTFTSPWLMAVAASTSVHNQNLITDPKQRHVCLSLPHFPGEFTKSLKVGSYDWEADITENSVPPPESGPSHHRRSGCVAGAGDLRPGPDQARRHQRGEDPHLRFRPQRRLAGILRPESLQQHRGRCPGRRFHLPVRAAGPDPDPAPSLRTAPGRADGGHPCPPQPGVHRRARADPLPSRSGQRWRPPDGKPRGFLVSSCGHPAHPHGPSQARQRQRRLEAGRHRGKPRRPALPHQMADQDQDHQRAQRMRVGWNPGNEHASTRRAAFLHHLP